MHIIYLNGFKRLRFGKCYIFRCLLRHQSRFGSCCVFFCLLYIIILTLAHAVSSPVCYVIAFLCFLWRKDNCICYVIAHSFGTSCLSFFLKRILVGRGGILCSMPCNPRIASSNLCTHRRRLCWHSQIIEKRPCSHQLLTPFPPNFLGSSIFLTSLREYIIGHSQLSVRKAGNHRTHLISVWHRKNGSVFGQNIHHHQRHTCY